MTNKKKLIKIYELINNTIKKKTQFIDIEKIF